MFLPGMMCDARLFAPQAATFERNTNVIVGDIAFADSVDALADGLLERLPSRFSLAGLSMGGIVAMAMAARAPKRIDRLALLDTNHRTDAPERRVMRDRQIADVRAGRLRDVIVEEMKPVYLAAANRQNRNLLDLLVDMAMDLGEPAFINQSLALRDRADQSAGLAAYRGPSLVLHGAEDFLCPPERHREIAALLTGADLVEIEGAGHITTLEQPKAVNDALAAWMSRPALRENDHA